MRIKYCYLLLFLSLRALSRDPFVWPTKQENIQAHTIATKDYHIVGIIFNTTTQHFNALLSYNNVIILIEQNDLLPNQAIVKNINHDQVELTNATGSVILNWFDT